MDQVEQADGLFPWHCSAGHTFTAAVGQHTAVLAAGGRYLDVWPDRVIVNLDL